MIKRSLASTTWPVEPQFNAGFMVSRELLAPTVGASLFVPVLPGAGPTLVLRGSMVGSGDLTILEGVAGVGFAFETQLGDMRARISVAPGVLVHSFSYIDESDAGVSVGPSVLVPLEVGLPLGGGVSFTLTIEPGLARGVTHVVNNELAYTRDRAFISVGFGLNFGGPPD